jgi:Aerotolerance regulator N-terminal
MSWLIPSALGIAVAAALIAVALHFIARSRPLAESLPTARFIPDRPIYARTRSIALTDLLLLLLRLAAIAAIGVAVAGPILIRTGRVARIVVADRSRAVANIDEVRDSVKSFIRAGDALVVFDSVAMLAMRSTIDSVKSTTAARGSLSTALAAATRVAALAAPDADSVEIVIVSPLAREEVDEATARLRAAWPGRIHLAPVAATPDVSTALRVEMRANSNDAVHSGLALMGVVGASGSVRLVRGALTAADSAWARETGHVLVHWPASDADASWVPRASIDAIGAVTSGSATLVARFPRLWILDGTPVARWADGEPAAVERSMGAGCIRDVGVLLDQASDLTLREPFRRFAASMLAPCGGTRSSRPIDSSVRATLAGNGSLAPSSTLRDRATESSRWTPWLLALAALLLIAELAVRRSVRGFAP